MPWANAVAGVGCRPPSLRFFGAKVYLAYDANNQVTLAPAAVQQSGGNQPHENMSPYLVLNFIIALQGIFPSQN